MAGGGDGRIGHWLTSASRLGFHNQTQQAVICRGRIICEVFSSAQANGKAILVRFKAAKAAESSALPDDHDRWRWSLIIRQSQADLLRVAVVIGEDSLGIPIHL